MTFATTLRSRPVAVVAGKRYVRTAKVSSQFLLGGNVVWANGALHGIGGKGMRADGMVLYRAYNMSTDQHVFLRFVQGAPVAEYDAA